MEILTVLLKPWGRPNSPYLGRGGHEIAVIKQTKRFSPWFSFAVPTSVGDWESEVVSACKFCTSNAKCLRHSTVLEIGNIMIPHGHREFGITIIQEDGKTTAVIRVLTGSGKLWGLVIDNEKVVIRRPSNIKFTYKRRDSVSSYDIIAGYVDDLINKIIFALRTQLQDLNAKLGFSRGYNDYMDEKMEKLRFILYKTLGWKTAERVLAETHYTWDALKHKYGE